MKGHSPSLQRTHSDICSDAGWGHHSKLWLLLYICAYIKVELPDKKAAIEDLLLKLSPFESIQGQPLNNGHMSCTGRHTPILVYLALVSTLTVVLVVYHVMLQMSQTQARANRNSLS